MLGNIGFRVLGSQVLEPCDLSPAPQKGLIVKLQCRREVSDPLLDRETSPQNSARPFESSLQVNMGIESHTASGPRHESNGKSLQISTAKASAMNSFLCARLGIRVESVDGLCGTLGTRAMYLPGVYKREHLVVIMFYTSILTGTLKLWELRGCSLGRL